MVKTAKNSEKRHKKPYDFRARTPYSTIMMMVICVPRFFIYTEVLHLDPPLQVYH